MDVTRTTEGDAMIMKIDGDLSVYEVESLRQELLAGLEASSACRLDLSAVTQCDTAAVQVLLAAQRSAAGAGKTVTVGAMGTAVRTVFDDLGLGADQPLRQ